MTLSPSTLRQDLKCGKGSISKGEKCKKGPATKAKDKSFANTGLVNKALVVGGAAALVGGAAFGVHKYRRGKAVLANELGSRATPEQQISKGKQVFKEMRGVSLGTKIAGAGIALAGAGLTKYGVENQNMAATMGGLYVMGIGGNTMVGGSKMNRSFNEQEADFDLRTGQYKKQYYQAQNEAKQRQKEGGSSHSKARTGSNKAVTDPFKDLGVPESASDAEIKKAWLKLLRTSHPDVGGDPRKASQYNAAYQEINRRRGRKDSIWASGFNIDWEAIAL